MNILYLTNHLNVGGITSYLFSLAKGMKKRGHRVYLASGRGRLIPLFVAAGIEHLSVPLETKSEISPRLLLSKFSLRRYIRAKNIDIIHANTRVTQVLSYSLQARLGVPFISTCHGFFKKRLFRMIFPCWGERVIAISQAVKEHLANDFKVAPGRIRVIPNGIDLDKFIMPPRQARDELKKKLGLKPGPIIGIVARLSAEKGHTHLINAMQLVLSVFPQAQLLIVGEGRLKGQLARLVKNKRLEANTLFLPSVNDTLGVLPAMDIFVLPSTKEGLGLALMEAMACGLAVVGSDIGGIKSLIRHNHNGLLVTPADAPALAKAILELLNNPGQAGSLGSSARGFIRDNFSQEKMVLDTERVYSECLKIKE